MQDSFRCLFLELISLDRLDFVSANALARTCPAAERAWRSVVLHEVSDQIAALYRGLALRYAISGMLRFEPLHTHISDIASEGEFLPGALDLDTASESDGPGSGTLQKTLHPGAFFALPPPPVNPALRNDAFCLQVSVAFGFPLEKREVSLFRAFALSGPVARVALQRSTLLARGGDYPLGLVRPLFQFHATLCGVLSTLQDTHGREPFFGAIRKAAAATPGTGKGPCELGIFPLPISLLSVFTVPEDGNPWHGQNVCEAATAVGIGSEVPAKHWLLPRAIREAAVSVEQAAGDASGTCHKFRILTQASCALVHGFMHAGKMPEKLPFQQVYCSATGFPIGDRVLGLARRYLAYTGDGSAQGLPDPRETTSALRDAHVAYTCATRFRKGQVVHAKDGQGVSWLQTDLGPVATHSGVHEFWRSVESLGKGEPVVPLNACSGNRTRKTVGPAQGNHALFFPCVDFILPAVPGEGIPRVRVLRHNAFSKAVHLYVAETNKAFAVLHKRSKRYVIRWTRAAFNVFFDARVAVLGTLRCRVLRAFDSGTFPLLVHKHVFTWKFKKQQEQQQQQQRGGKRKRNTQVTAGAEAKTEAEALPLFERRAKKLLKF